jgi:hypothetical protein
MALQDLRNETGKPIGISSGYRCSNFNKQVGGDANSAHLQGGAADFYFEDSSLGDQNYRVSIVNKLKTIPQYHWCYCNVNGNYPNMGSAIHLDTLPIDYKEPVKEEPKKEEPIINDLEPNTATKEENNTNTLEDNEQCQEQPKNEKIGIIKWLLEALIDILKKILEKM